VNIGQVIFSFIKRVIINDCYLIGDNEKKDYILSKILNLLINVKEIGIIIFHYKKQIFLKMVL